MRTRIRLMAALSAIVLVSTAACSQQGKSSGDDEAVGPPQRGGTITVLEDQGFGGSWPSGLDPATNTTGGANIPMMYAIYGGLFQLKANDDGSNAKIVPHQAESYEVSEDGRELTITIRDGIKFTDGTPLTAEAVKFNIDRNMKAECSCRPTWPLRKKDGVTLEGDRTLVLHFDQPQAAAISNIPASNVNWIASPDALEKLGDKFRLTPVGAGPFTVVSNRLSSELKLKRNPNYFRKGLPYLDGLNFKSIGGDQPAYQALLAGQAQAYEGNNTVPLLEQAEKSGRLNVTVQPATSPYVVQLNTRIAPFNDKKAREAIYHATDFNAIAKGLFKGQYKVSQSFTGEGGLFHNQSVPGYRTPDLAKAKQLVQEVGGIKVTLGTLKTPVATQVNVALQTQWKKAGIDVEIEDYELNGLIQEFGTGKWQAMLQTAGAWDPAAGVGVGFRFLSYVPYSGVEDKELDELLVRAGSEPDAAQRNTLYQEAGKLISDNAYAPFGVAFAPANLTAKDVHGPGLDTKIPPLVVNSTVIWDEVWRAQ